jgi:hypothetical protein
MKKPTWFIFSLLLIISCLDQPDCFRLNNNVIGIAFRVMGGEKPDTVEILDVQLSGANVIISPEDSLVTGIGLPLNYTTGQTELTFNGSAETRSMLLSYLVSTQFVSEDCGERYILSGLEVQEHNFDSVRVVSASPGKTASTNIEVYRCPVTDVMQIVFRQLTVTSTGAKSSQIVGVGLNKVTTDFTATSLYDNSRAASVYLPVNLSKDSTTFSFDMADDGVRKLSLGYTRTSDERYNPCGSQTFVTRMNILEAGTDFDSVSFVTDTDGRLRRAITDPVEQMLQVYRCPVTNLAGVTFRQRLGSRVIQDTVVLKNLTVDFPATIAYPDGGVRSVNIPLNPASNRTVITFEFETGIKTVTVTYRTTTQSYFKQACSGTQTFFSGLTVESTDFATVNVLNEDLRNLPILNLEVIQ